MKNSLCPPIMQTYMILRTKGVFLLLFYKIKAFTSQNANKNTFDSVLFYKKIYFNTNNTANTYINGVIFLPLLQITLITT